MDIRPIRNDTDYDEAVAEIARLWGAPVGSPEGDKLDVLATLVDAYASNHWQLPRSTPTEVLRYAISDMGRSQTELAELLRSRSQASDLLSGRRRVSLELAQKISAGWNIPIQLLVAPYEKTAVA